MKKTLISAIAVFICCIGASAQDIIVMRDGKSIEAIVLEISTSYVKYKRFDYQNGPTFTTKAETISRIEFQNGTSQEFNPQESRAMTDAAGESADGHNTSEKQNYGQYQSAAKPGEKLLRFGVHAGVSIPTGLYGNYITAPATIYSEKGAAAGAGATFGCKMLYGIKKVKGLSIVTNLDFVINPTKKEAENLINDIFSSVANEDYAFRVDKMPVFVSVPITAGINYKYNFNKTIGVWGEFAAGANLRFISSLKLINTAGSHYMYTENGIQLYSTDEESYNYNPNIQFAYQTGCGILLWDKLTLGIMFNGTNRSKIKGTSRGKIYDDSIDDSMREPFYGGIAGYSCIMIRAGYIF